MLLHPRIIPQIFQVFQESDFQLRMCDSNIPTRSSWSNRLTIRPLPDGRLGITIGVENLEHEHSYADMVIVLFDGRNTVSIASQSDVRCEADLNDPDKLHTVAIEDTRQILIEQYGVSFEEQWRMNEAPVFDLYGIPYDPDYWFRTDGMDVDEIEDSDKELVHGYFLAERVLNEISSDNTVLDVDGEFQELLNSATAMEDE